MYLLLGEWNPRPWGIAEVHDPVNSTASQLLYGGVVDVQRGRHQALVVPRDLLLVPAPTQRNKNAKGSSRNTGRGFSSLRVSRLLNKGLTPVWFGALPLKPPVDQRREDVRERLLAKLREGHHAEVPEVSVGDAGPPPPRGSHGRYKLDVHQRAERQLLAVVPPAVVHILAEQFDGRLRAIHLHGGHV
eukprot:1177194-Prorocentrum_minimum.AAC.11